MSPASNARRVTIREWSGLLAFLGSLALAACGSGGSGSTPCQSNADCPAERICQGATCQAVGISIASPSDGTATNGTLQVQLAVAGAGGGTAALVLDGAPLATLSPPY